MMNATIAGLARWLVKAVYGVERIVGETPVPVVPVAPRAVSCALLEQRVHALGEGA